MTRWALAIALAATACGCAAPMAKYWSQHKTSREIENLTKEGSFPTAAQAGIASSELTKKN